MKELTLVEIEAVKTELKDILVKAGLNEHLHAMQWDGFQRMFLLPAGVADKIKGALRVRYINLTNRFK